MSLVPIFYTNQDQDQLAEYFIPLFERENKFFPEIKYQGQWFKSMLFSSSMLSNPGMGEVFQRKYHFHPSQLFEKNAFPLYLSWNRNFLYPMGPSQNSNILNWNLLAIQNKDIVGVVTGKINFETRIASLSYVEINPRFQGQKLCKSLVILTLEQLRKEFPSIKTFYIENASGEKLAACYCYLRAAEALHFKITDKNGTPQSSTERCISITPQGKFYFTVP